MRSNAEPPRAACRVQFAGGQGGPRQSANRAALSCEALRSHGPCRGKSLVCSASRAAADVHHAIMTWTGPLSSAPSPSRGGRCFFTVMSVCLNDHASWNREPIGHDVRQPPEHAQW